MTRRRWKYVHNIIPPLIRAPLKEIARVVEVRQIEVERSKEKQREREMALETKICLSFCVSVCHLSLICQRKYINDVLLPPYPPLSLASSSSLSPPTPSFPLLDLSKFLHFTPTGKKIGFRTVVVKSKRYIFYFYTRVYRI